MHVNDQYKKIAEEAAENGDEKVDAVDTIIKRPLKMEDTILIRSLISERYYERGDVWSVNLLPLYTVQNIIHGITLVGPSGAGKSEQYEIDPKGNNEGILMQDGLSIWYINIRVLRNFIQLLPLLAAYWYVFVF